jgi:hypothetical protein
MKKHARYTLALAGVVTLALTGNAHAYLDPGTGSILLQMLIGGVVGGLFIVKMQWARLKAWFASKTGAVQGDSAE